MDSTTDPTLSQLEVFRAVAACGSFSAAARQLGRAQSAVSYTIAALESALGVALFDREGRRPTLTPAGRALLEDAHAVAGQVERLIGRASALRHQVEPEVILVVDGMFPLDLLMDGLCSMATAFPDVGVRIRSEALDAVPALVRAREAHLGICPTIDTDGDDLDRFSVAPVELVAVVGRDHPLARLGWDHLAHHVQIVLSARGSTRPDRGVWSPRTWRVGDLPTRVALVRRGFGWANLPRHLVADDLERGGLVEIPHGKNAPRVLPMAAITHRASPPGPAGRHLLGVLVSGSADAAGPA
ncbi:MAG: LysR family transcriptional regulator [Myxococcota bacterium]